MNKPESSELGKKTIYPTTYDKGLLFPIPRSEGRESIGIRDKIPFAGYDIWNAWEVSFLNSKGKPLVCIASFVVPCESRFITESKSLKLYLNSLNEHSFESLEQAKNTIAEDLSDCVKAKVQVIISPLNDYPHIIHKPKGICLDDLDITWKSQAYSPSILAAVNNTGESETLFSNLLKSNCPVTNQPDWATLIIKYTGSKLDHKSLLKYILSFRDHNEFHEQCVERIYRDISNLKQIESLTVSARYTRRGGIDINPIRSSEPLTTYENLRFIRQ
ncbi:MAG: NADPH-dependent 7-cyano-7-deazaguanine reductase QueF [Oligoflexales bacterium]